MLELATVPSHIVVSQDERQARAVVQRFDTGGAAMACVTRSVSGLR